VYLQTATTSGKCGQTKTLFLDGQCFGKPGVRSDNTPRIDLTLPSGNSAMASDFESWFYLAPLPEVDEVTFNGESSGASITLNANGFGTIAGSVTLVAPPVRRNHSQSRGGCESRDGYAPTFDPHLCRGQHNFNSSDLYCKYSTGSRHIRKGHSLVPSPRHRSWNLVPVSFSRDSGPLIFNLGDHPPQ